MVGINTANPRVALEVNGNIIASKYSDVSGYDNYYLQPGVLDPTDSNSSLSLTKEGSSNGMRSTQWRLGPYPCRCLLKIQNYTNGLLFAVSESQWHHSRPPSPTEQYHPIPFQRWRYWYR